MFFEKMKSDVLAEIETLTKDLETARACLAILEQSKNTAPKSVAKPAPTASAKPPSKPAKASTMRVKLNLSALRDANDRKLYDALSKADGEMSANDVYKAAGAEKLGLTRAGADYKLGRMVKAKLVKQRRDGRLKFFAAV